MYHLNPVNLRKFIVTRFRIEGKLEWDNAKVISYPHVKMKVMKVTNFLSGFHFLVSRNNVMNILKQDHSRETDIRTCNILYTYPGI